MKRKTSPFLLAIVGSLVVIVFGLMHALLKHPPYAPPVKSEQQTDSGLQAHQGDNAKHAAADNAPPGLPSIGSKGSGGEGQPKTEHGEDEGTEFWPALYGYRLKVTDTLVAAFTALLFFATIALWLSTRRLVFGAEKTAERQLRAYVSIVGGHVIVVATDHNRLFIKGNLEFKNSGQTPAYKFAPWTRMDIFDEGIEPTEKAATDQDAIFGPGSASQVEIVRGPLPEATIEAIRNGTKIIWIWGEVAYADGFGNEYIFEHRNKIGRMRPDRNSWPVVAVRTTERKTN